MKEPKCKWCKKEFKRQQSTQVVCSLECAIDYQRAKAIKRKKEKEDGWPQRKKELKKAVTTLPQLKKKLQANINEIARKIDYGHNCMMCNKPIKKPQACHYHSVGSNDSLRFNLMNIWAGCYACNVHKSGNILGYDQMIIEKFGRDRWRYIKFDLVKDYSLIKLSKIEIVDLIVYTNNIKKNIEEKRRSSMVRWRKREQLNKLIGIYTSKFKDHE